MYQRSYYSKINERIASKQQFIQVIMGPRQVGKTTLARQITKNYSYPFIFASADEARNPDWFSQQWEACRIKIKSEGVPEALLVIDEIQKIEDWSKLVKIEWDRDRKNEVNLKVILLGSSQLILQKGLSESLAGRFEVIYIPHWSYLEMHDAFDFSFDEYTWFGGYPGPAEIINDEERWKEYIQYSLIETTLMRDVIQMVRIDKPVLIRNLFDLSCNLSGQILSFNKILGQLADAGNTSTLANYLKLLDGAGMVSGIEKYSESVIRQRASSPKLQVFNMALMSSRSHLLKDEVFSKPEIYGRWIESVTGTHLINLCKVEHTELFYWREANYEVDFVIRKGKKIVGMEVKSGNYKPPAGIQKFNKIFHPAKILLVGKGGIPIEEFLKLSLSDIFV